MRVCISVLLCLVHGIAFAHSFGTPYNLPIPFWMYVYGCAGTLVVTFAVLGYFVGASAVSRPAPVLDISVNAVSAFAGRWALRLLRVGAFACLLLTIVAGIVGSDDPGRNISMTLFWVIFLMGMGYLTLVIGDLYALINPWKSLLALLERVGLDFTTPRWRYPSGLGAWPAFAFYVALIWIELFVLPSPAILAVLLTVYTAITVCGAAVFGKVAWFQHADFFSVFFRLIGLMAPVEYVETQQRRWRIRLRVPFSGAIAARPEHISLVLFVLFMLSSTAYDGIHESQYWTALFWRNLMTLLQPLWGTDLGAAQNMLMGWFVIYRKAGLLIFPLIYFCVYLLAVSGAKLIARSAIPLRTLVFDFCYSLLPIAFAYHFTHYFSFLVFQGAVLPWLVTDPLGFGWNWLGLSENPQDPALQMGIIWHTQVGVILIGHVVSVILAHQAAMRTFPTQRDVIASQLPLLVLMVAYTMIGIWILMLPLG